MLKSKNKNNKRVSIMSYVINIEHHENQVLGAVEINDYSLESRTARRCRFQTIGWILGIVDKVNSKIDPSLLADEQYAQKALMTFAMMGEDAANRLIAARDWRRRFEIVWAILNDEERDHALHYDYDDWDNFWPGFDTFNRTFFEAMALLRAAPAVKESRPHDYAL
jgi:hypothetical protein